MKVSSNDHPNAGVCGKSWSTEHGLNISSQLPTEKKKEELRENSFISY
jgi:hypothetical protein